MNVSRDKTDADIVCAYTIGNRKQLSVCKITIQEAERPALIV